MRRDWSALTPAVPLCGSRDFIKAHLKGKMPCGEQFVIRLNLGRHSLSLSLSLSPFLSIFIPFSLSLTLSFLTFPLYHVDCKIFISCFTQPLFSFEIKSCVFMSFGRQIAVIIFSDISSNSLLIFKAILYNVIKTTLLPWHTQIRTHTTCLWLEEDVIQLFSFHHVPVFFMHCKTSLS